MRECASVDEKPGREATSELKYPRYLQQNDWCFHSNGIVCADTDADAATDADNLSAGSEGRLKPKSSLVATPGLLTSSASFWAMFPIITVLGDKRWKFRACV